MQLDREWEKFAGGPTPAHRDRIHVTLNRRGLIYLNENAYRLLGRPDAVQLYFNRSKDKIALKPVHERIDDAFPVKKKNGHHLIHASPFCRHYGIKLTTTEKFVNPDIWEGVLQLNLATTVTVSGNRSKRER